jgi:hypothetical protein
MAPEPTSLSQKIKQAQATLSTRVAAISAAARRRPKVLFAAATVLLVVGGVGAAVAVLGPEELRESAEELLGDKPLSLAELKARAKASPKDAGVQLALAHGYFAAGSRSTAVKTYGKVLSLDAKQSDGTLVKNLLACFGKAEQGSAAGLIGKYKLEDAASGLVSLTKSRTYSIRWEAVRTLEKLGKAGAIDYGRAYELDLEVTDCDIRRRAIERLGKVGDKGSLSAIRAAAKKDEGETPWYRSSCLGKLPDEAEKKIASRK